MCHWLVATVSAVVTEGCVDQLANKPTASPDLTCECAAGCNVCKGVSLAGATLASKTQIGADQCFECTSATDTLQKVVPANDFGTCTPSPSGGPGGGGGPGGLVTGCLDALANRPTATLD